VDLVEISDLVIDHVVADGRVIRRPVEKAKALARLQASGQSRAAWVLRQFPTRSKEDDDTYLDETHVDGVLQRSHMELQRLHEEFLMGVRATELLLPLVRTIAERKKGPVRIVDVGCGPGFVVRWLAHHDPFGALPVELVGVDLNGPLIELGSALARAERLPCTFIHGSAFDLAEEADIFFSSGALHHFRGDDLATFFREQANAASSHFDIKPSVLAPVGSFIFHEARMREPLARYDGYLSAVRAHPESALVEAAMRAAPEHAVGVFDGRAGLLRLTRIMHAMVSIPREMAERFLHHASHVAHRFRWWSAP
jgi:SAM-dependent methyltransferase